MKAKQISCNLITVMNQVESRLLHNVTIVICFGQGDDFRVYQKIQETVCNNLRDYEGEHIPNAGNRFMIKGMRRLPNKEKMVEILQPLSEEKIHFW